MKRLILSLLLAFLLWSVMFSPLTAPHVPFWWMMTGSAVLLAILAGCFHRNWWQDITWRTSDGLWGIGLAVALWSLFWIGDKLAIWLFDLARPEVDLIYGMKNGESLWLLASLMLFLIGPAEEIFWRGYVQKTFSNRWNPNIGLFVATLLYTLVHSASCNLMLILAAAVAGSVWGLCYRFFPTRLPILIISHSLWDVAVFILFPI